jgi:hypothetical protein
VTFATQLAAAFTPIGGVYDSPSVTQALSWAESFVCEYCNRGDAGFDLTTGVTSFIDPAPYGRALIPNIPVANVESVQAWLPSQTSDGMAWTTLTNWAFVADTGLIYNTTGLPGTDITWTFGPTWPWLPASLQVTYDYGYSTVPGALINAAVRFAQQYLENPALLLQREVGSFSERYAGNSGGVGIVIDAFDQRILDRYTLVSIA